MLKKAEPAFPADEPVRWWAHFYPSGLKDAHLDLGAGMTSYIVLSLFGVLHTVWVCEAQKGPRSAPAGAFLVFSASDKIRPTIP
jgi:hypothetical protein